MLLCHVLLPFFFQSVALFSFLGALRVHCSLLLGLSPGLCFLLGSLKGLLLGEFLGVHSCNQDFHHGQNPVDGRRQALFSLWIGPLLFPFGMFWQCLHGYVGKPQAIDVGFVELSFVHRILKAIEENVANVQVLGERIGIEDGELVGRVGRL